MVILFVTGEYPPDIGGVGDYTAHLQHALAQLRYPSRVLTRRQVRRWDARSLIWLVRKAPPSGIVHIQFQAGAFDLLGDVCLMPSLLRRLRPRVRTVTTFHDVRAPYLFPRAGMLREMAVRLLARTSDAVIAADRRDLRALADVSRREYHVPIGSNIACAPPPGFDRDAFRRSIGLDSGALAIVFFGLANAGHNARLLQETFERIRSRAPRARLLVLGGTSAWLPPSELSAHLLACDVALLPYADGASARHGSLLVCAEHGLPIVSTQPVGAEVAPFIEAVLPEPSLLADAVLRVAAAPASRKANSRALAESASWTRIGRCHEDIYTELLHSPP